MRRKCLSNRFLGGGAGEGLASLEDFKMSSKYRFAKIVVYLNPDSPISLALHSVPADFVNDFITEVEEGTTKFCVLEFDTPVGPKRLSVDTAKVIAIDTVFTEGSGKKSDDLRIVPPSSSSPVDRLDS